MSKPRKEVAGGVHHVCARGANKQLIFKCHADREAYLRLLIRAIEKCGWRVLAVCLMPNHVHLIVETPEPNLGKGMHLLHTPYALDFRTRHGERGMGHVFQGPFVSTPARDEARVWRDLAYVALNPVKHGFCKRPEDWEWNSYTTVLAGEAPAWLDTQRLFELFEIVPGDGRANYLEFIDRQWRLLELKD